MNQDNEVLVRVNGVSKKFCRDLKKSLWYGMCDVASELLPFGKKESGIRDQESGETREALSDHSKFKIQNSKSSPGLRPGEFWANKDISFELRRGECLGLIGHNGAGKTTLLKMLNGLIKPDEGFIETRGRVGALIALGAGFNPILTGRENIYVNGMVLGLTREEVDQKMAAIIDFAEIHAFIDAPVQSYSSGMQVRLGFAVASSMDPDILIIDEVLAVGDIAFRTKCFNRIFEICRNAAVIFVSHNMPQVNRLCGQALLLNQGKGQLYETVDAIHRYNLMAIAGKSEWNMADGVELCGLRVNHKRADSTYTLLGGEPFELEIDILLPEAGLLLELAVSFLQPSGDLCLQANNLHQGIPIKALQKRTNIRFYLHSLPLGSGAKSLSIRVLDSTSKTIYLWNQCACQLLVKNEHYRPAPAYIDANFTTK